MFPRNFQDVPQISGSFKKNIGGLKKFHLNTVKKMPGFYCKECDAYYSSGYPLMKHIFTLKYQKNCGNDEYKKEQLIGACAYQIVQGDEPKCSTFGLTYALDIAEREYDLGLLVKKTAE